MEKPDVCDPAYIRWIAGTYVPGPTYLAGCYQRTAYDPAFNGLDYRVLKAVEALPQRAMPITSVGNWNLVRLLDVAAAKLRKPRIRVAAGFDALGALVVRWVPIYGDPDSADEDLTDFLCAPVDSAVAEEGSCIVHVEGAERGQAPMARPLTMGAPCAAPSNTWVGRDVLQGLLLYVLDYLGRFADVTVSNWLVAVDGRSPLKEVTPAERREVVLGRKLAAAEAAQEAASHMLVGQLAVLGLAHDKWAEARIAAEAERVAMIRAGVAPQVSTGAILRVLELEQVFAEAEARAASLREELGQNRSAAPKDTGGGLGA